MDTIFITNNTFDYNFIWFSDIPDSNSQITQLVLSGNTFSGSD